MHRRTVASLVLAGAAAVTACADGAVSPAAVETVQTSLSGVSGERQKLVVQGVSLDAVNEALAERGISIAVARAEFVLAAHADGPLVETANHTIFTNNRQLRLDSRWVPGDVRRDADGNHITFLNFGPFMPANWGTPSQFDGEPAIDASFATWNAVRCSNVELLKRPDTGAFPSAIFAGGNPFLADIVTLGFLPGLYFDLVLGPGASSNVLGVTFTFVWLQSPGGPPSDIDADGRNDTALKEVWYNDAFNWSEGGQFDVETVALHENGHAMELGHFGLIHATFNNGRGNVRPGTLHVSPRAVMNAFILGTLRTPLGTDIASYCGNFGSWPD